MLKMTSEKINAARWESAEKALKALKILNELSELNGNAEMTLEEINAETYAARREMEVEEARRAQ